MSHLASFRCIEGANPLCISYCRIMTLSDNLIAPQLSALSSPFLSPLPSSLVCFVLLPAAFQSDSDRTRNAPYRIGEQRTQRSNMFSTALCFMLGTRSFSPSPSTEYESLCRLTHTAHALPHLFDLHARFIRFFR